MRTKNNLVVGSLAKPPHAQVCECAMLLERLKKKEKERTLLCAVCNEGELETAAGRSRSRWTRKDWTTPKPPIYLPLPLFSPFTFPPSPYSSFAVIVGWHGNRPSKLFRHKFESST